MAEFNFASYYNVSETTYYKCFETTRNRLSKVSCIRL